MFYFFESLDKENHKGFDTSFGLDSDQFYYDGYCALDFHLNGIPILSS